MFECRRISWRMCSSRCEKSRPFLIGLPLLRPIQTWTPAKVGRVCPQRAGLDCGAGGGALNYYMRKSAQSAKILGTPPERGHSCPQQLPNTQQDRNVRELYFRSTLLRTRMSALRFGSGSAGLGTARPTAPLSLKHLD